MDQLPATTNEELETRLSSIRGLATLRISDAADRLNETLAHAAAESTTEAESTELDRAVVHALRGAMTPDPILTRLTPSHLDGLLQRWSRRLAAAAGTESEEDLRRVMWDTLDLTRRPAFASRLNQDDVAGWSARILDAVEVSHLTVGPLFRQRAETYGSKVLFKLPRSVGRRNVSWRRAASRVELLARGLLALDEAQDPAPVAVLCENSIQMAMSDLACLTSGLVNVMVPANSTETDVGYILRHCRARTVIVSDRSQLHKVLMNRESLPQLRNIVSIELPGDAPEDVVDWNQLFSLSERVPAAEVRRRGMAVRIDDPATVMYTSGTTGTPKAIQFSHRNLVFKRFARGLALPEIGEDDVFLCFLPLFHTFGRFLEMLGCVFWGATYCFLENPSMEALLRGMRQHRPTVFISVPKRWIQLHEAVSSKADPLEASDEQLLEATRSVTGGRLRWGLSAAGHLDAEVFRFFQAQGIELVSGFGMTEATGGITMTPPGEYSEDSLGVALPGIELKLADDGELMIRGPYVMTGYLDPPDGLPSFDDEGWFPTGDLMRVDNDGHLRLVDRKKEIYKNIKGETIAPQRIENMFRELDSVGRAFLVGDHCEYNTLLIYPNPNYEELDLASLSESEIRDHFRSLVVSVNKFLAPYERIVDFAVIERDLDPERDELTPKGTPRRQTVARNFADVISQMYRQTSLQVGGVELIVPNWLVQALGLTAQDIIAGENKIMLPSRGAELAVRSEGETRIQVGASYYDIPRKTLDLGQLVCTPRLWMGNEALVEFVSLELAELGRPEHAARGMEWSGRPAPYLPRKGEVERVERAIDHSTWGWMDLELAARLLQADDERCALGAVRLIECILTSEEGRLTEPARLILARAASAGPLAIRRRAFQVLVPAERPTRFRRIVTRFLAAEPDLLDAETCAVLCERDLPEEKLEAFVRIAVDGCLTERHADAALDASLLHFLAEYGAGHPVRYRRLRAVLVRISLLSPNPEILREATKAIELMEQGFRQWLGPTVRIAVDPETGHEYRWEDVVVFDDSVDDDDRQRLLSAIKNTTLLREASFLFGKGILIRLSDIPPGGVWIRLLGALHGKAVYRITIQTRFQGATDLAVNVNHSLSPQEVRDEINWLILCGDPGNREQLVEDFGGYWPEQDLWSEEFITGETLARALRRLSRRRGEEDRYQQLWPFLAWTALSAFVDFWNRSGRRWEIADFGMTNVVVPTDDYLTGARIVSVTSRRPHGGLRSMLGSFRDEFIAPVERQYSALADLVDCNVVLSSVLEVVGEDEGLALLDQVLREEGELLDADLRDTLERYVANVHVRGFLPRRLFFAAKRYRRWARLNEDATLQARARTLQELYETYGLPRMAQKHPEIRVRFFRETVFREGSPALAEGLDALIGELRRRELLSDELLDAVAELRAKLDLNSDEEYFLARLSFPYLRPEDAADFVSGNLGGEQQSEIVVKLEDADGNPFRVRHALNPKEVDRLHRQFLTAKLDVRFRPEHRYLVAINDRQQLVGGIYYEVEEGGETAHLEKIVVSHHYRRKGVADGLMKELFNRLRATGVKTVTTGFFRPEYFYSYGFRIEKRYAGLVKSLDDKTPPESEFKNGRG
jgi:long-subunit acyl-CoA synthetase (AMP-forming)/GNAT superfamily N-acetyltransferase